MPNGLSVQDILKYIKNEFSYPRDYRLKHKFFYKCENCLKTNRYSAVSLFDSHLILICPKCGYRAAISPNWLNSKQNASKNFLIRTIATGMVLAFIGTFFVFNDIIISLVNPPKIKVVTNENIISSSSQQPTITEATTTIEITSKLAEQETIVTTVKTTAVTTKHTTAATTTTKKATVKTTTQVLNGYGTKKYANGDNYEGDLKAGVPSGQGTMYFNNGEKYYGSFVNGKMDGFGTYTYSDGTSFDGYWKNGAFNRYA